MGDFVFLLFWLLVAEVIKVGVVICCFMIWELFCLGAASLGFLIYG